MASTPEGAQISEEHRQRQIALRALITARLLQLWQAFDVTDIDASWTVLEPAVLAIVADGRRVSSQLATQYFREYRAAERVPGTLPDLQLVEATWQDAARASLRITGPIAAKKLVLAKARRPADVAFVRMSGAATRIVGNGGRDTLSEVVQRDRRAIGYARVTSGVPCAFCAMLASRGPIYKSSGSVSFHSHDHCSCYPEPVYSRDAAWPGRGRDFQRLYKSSTAGAPNPRLAFRRAYEGR